METGASGIVDCRLLLLDTNHIFFRSVLVHTQVQRTTKRPSP